MPSFPKAPPLSSLLNEYQGKSEDYGSAPLPKRKHIRRKAFRRAAATTLLISLFIAYQLYREYEREPQNSILNDIMIRLNGGRPYRDYLRLSDISNLEGNVYSLITKDPAFSILIPKDLFLRPGIIFNDNIPDSSFGNMEISDVFGNYVSWSWSRMDPAAVVRISSSPQEYMKKIKEYATAMLGRHEQEGYIVMHEEILRHNPESGRWESSTPVNGGTNPNDVLQEHVVPYFHTFIIVNDKENNQLGYFPEEPTLLPSAEHWQACSFFVHDGHIFVTSTAYPNNLINFAIMREHVLENQVNEPQGHHVQKFEDGIVKYLESIENDRARNRMVSTINAATFEHDQIIITLRDMLFQRMNEFIPEEPPARREEYALEMQGSETGSADQNSSKST